MSPTQRALRPPERRRRILDAAPRCFARKGYAATTIGDIRRASGASIGSLYHHFGSKQELAGALYPEALRDYHEDLLARIRTLEGAEALVEGIVLHYVAWVTRHPDWARYLIEMRRTESVRAVDREIHAAILTGPAQTLAAHWLPQRRLDELRAAAPVLADAAWRALRRPL